MVLDLRMSISEKILRKEDAIIMIIKVIGIITREIMTEIIKVKEAEEGNLTIKMILKIKKKHAK